MRTGSAMMAETPDPETEAIHRDNQRTLQRLLAALPEEHREVLVLREIEDLEYREIAAITNLPIGTVMSRLARARAALRTRWLQREPGGSQWNALNRCACRRISTARSMPPTAFESSGILAPAPSASSCWRSSNRSAD